MDAHESHAAEASAKLLSATAARQETGKPSSPSFAQQIAGDVRWALGLLAFVFIFAFLRSLIK
jgi:hypothetical protein